MKTRVSQDRNRTPLEDRTRPRAQHRPEAGGAQAPWLAKGAMGHRVRTAGSVGTLVATVMALAWVSAGESRAAEAKQRLKRSEAFLGMHFDFHAGPDCNEIGRNTTPAMVENLLKRVGPDYIQVDCKGHAGFSSYPTRVGNPAPGFVGDPLRIWRDVTAARGVSLYLHYSGVWDSEAVRLNPDWAVRNADGKPDVNATSVFGPYADRLLIPQLRELAGSYGIDGVWVDGECWATVPDYGETAVSEFRRQTGIATPPRSAKDPGWTEWMQFHREAFRRYLRHYVGELKQSHPQFEVCSNWAFSDHMPEPVSVDMAFLSGDFSPQNSVNSARFSARCLANQGRPWDLMAWSFSAPQGHPVRPLKSAEQLQQEAAVVLAQGGGFQAYFRQKRDGSIFDWQMEVMAEVAQFCRARQKWCHRQEIVPQVALLYSTAGHYRSSPRLFAPYGSAGIQGLRGVLQGLLDAQVPVQIVSEHHFTGQSWPLVIVPEWDYLEPAFRDRLVQHARDGGRLLLIGPRTVGLFKEALPEVQPQGEPAVQGRYLAFNGVLAGLNTLNQPVAPGPNTRVFGRLHSDDDPRATSIPAATVTRVGSGAIGALHFNFGDRYLNGRTHVARELLSAVVQDLFPTPIVAVTGSHAIDVSVGRKDGNLLVNLVNTAGPHEQEKQFVFDAIPAVGPLEVSVRLEKKPRSIRLEPAGRTLRFQWSNGMARFSVPPVAIYDIAVILP